MWPSSLEPELAAAFCNHRQCWCIPGSDSRLQMNAVECRRVLTRWADEWFGKGTQVTDCP